jgi:hypothetical protein
MKFEGPTLAHFTTLALRRLDTTMIQNADHMYDGEEAQVAQTIAKWADTLVRR